jgi:hypothetical protein
MLGVPLCCLLAVPTLSNEWRIACWHRASCIYAACHPCCLSLPQRQISNPKHSHSPCRSFSLFFSGLTVADCLQGVEATVFGLLMSLHIASHMLGRVFGSLLVTAFGVTSTNFQNLAKLVLVRADSNKVLPLKDSCLNCSSGLCPSRLTAKLPGWCRIALQSLNSFSWMMVHILGF